MGTILTVQLEAREAEQNAELRQVMTRSVEPATTHTLHRDNSKGRRRQADKAYGPDTDQ